MLTVTCAAIFNRRSRMVPAVARARTVPCKVLERGELHLLRPPAPPATTRQRAEKRGEPVAIKAKQTAQ